MKYYVYVSDAKVDMLLGQIPQKKKSLAHEAGVNLGILKLMSKVASESVPTRFGRLETVVEAIKSEEWCGPVELGAPYIEDAGRGHWGRKRRQHPEDPEEPVFFKIARDSTVLVMTGSPAHLIGAAPAPPRHESSSSMQAFDRAVQKRFAAVDDDADRLADAAGLRYRPVGCSAWYNALDDLITELDWFPAQKLEFIARRLVSYTDEAKTVTLATPLYVALAD